MTIPIVETVMRSAETAECYGTILRKWEVNLLLYRK